MQYYSRKASKFLDLVWKDAIYKDPEIDHQAIVDMLEFDYYKQSSLMCRRNFGLRIKRFFNTCRVADVKQFLDQPENRSLSLLEVVRRTGYPRRRMFNKHFKRVEEITPTQFRFFLVDFEKTTGTKLVEYQKPETEKYMPEDNKPTFLSNFLNRQVDKVLLHENIKQ